MYSFIVNGSNFNVYNDLTAETIKRFAAAGY